MVRWLVFGVLTVGLGVAATVYLVWVHPTGRRLEQSEERLRSLHDSLPERWAVAPGMSPAVEGNLVPTEGEIIALDSLLGRPLRDLGGRQDHDAIERWKRGMGEPPFELVQAVRRDPELGRALDELAIGDHGAATGASGDRLDEAILWMVARAWVQDEDCLARAIDAVRVAQAIQPLARQVSGTYAPYGASESEALHSIEARWMQCGMRADPGKRRDAIEALERLEREQPFPLSRHFLLDWLDERADELRRRRDEEVPFVSDDWEARRDALETSMDDVERYVRFDGPFAELQEHLGPGLHDLSDWNTRHHQIVLESRLLRAAFHHLNHEPFDHLGYFDIEVVLHDAEGVPASIVGRGGDMACESMFDATVAVDAEYVAQNQRRWAGDTLTSGVQQNR